LWFSIALIGMDCTKLRANTGLSSTTNSARLSQLLGSLAVVEVIAFGIIYGLLWFNRRKKAKMLESSLNEKYQIDENIRSITLMIPMILTHFCCFMPTLVMFPIYMKIDPTLNPKHYTTFSESLNFAPFYPAILPLILFWRHKSLRESLRKVTGINNKISTLSARYNGLTEEQIQHFASLKEMWAM
jgi:hypothetical protein